MSAEEADVVLLGVCEKDLPFADKKKTPEELLFSLTGVSSTTDRGSTHANNGRLRGVITPHLKRVAPAQKAKTSSSINHQTVDAATQSQPIPESLGKGQGYREKALDTYDLGFWTYIVLPDKKKKLEEESSSDTDSEERERATIKAALRNVKTPDEDPKDAQTKQREYWARLKETLGSIRMRTQMLQDLSFADASKYESLVPVGANKDGDGNNPAGVIVKQARRLAELMHMEEQALSLRDLHQWLQTVGKGLSEGARNHPKSALQNQLDRLRSLNTIKDTQEPLPTNASSELLQQVERNLRDRLANLYQGKNFILSHQADFMTNGDLDVAASGESGVKEEIFAAIMERLQKMETAYEILGATILDSSKEVEKMEEEFQMLQSELVTKGCPLRAIHEIKKTKKSSNKKSKKATHSEGDDTNRASESEVSSALNSSRLTSAKSDKGGGKNNGLDEGEQPLNKDDTDGRNDVKEGKKRSDNKDRSKKEKKKNSSSQKAEKQKEVKIDIRKGGNSAENSGKNSTQSSSRNEKTDRSVSSTMVSETSDGKSVTIKENVHSRIENANVISEEGKMFFFPDTKGVADDCSEFSRPIEVQDNMLYTENKVFLSKDACNVPNTMMHKMKSHRASFGGCVEELVQTDDVVIISLKGGFEDIPSSQYQQMDVKDMLENMKKLQKQVQFWRTKNWAEKHREHGRFTQAPVYSSVSQFTKLHTSPEMGLVFYYNPQTSICAMKSVSDLDSSMQQAILGLTSEPKKETSYTPSLS